MSLILPAFSSPDLKAFPLCSKSSKSSEGGQGETVSSTSFQPQTRLTLASALWPQWFLVDVCARAGKTLISRSNLSASGSCRALRACPLWHLWPISASAHADAKTVPKHHRPEMDLPLRRVCFRTVVSRLQVVPGVIQMPMCGSPGRTSFEVPLNYL